MPYTYEDKNAGSPFFLDELKSSTDQVLNEQFATAFEENPIMAAYRWYSLAEDRRTGKKLTKAEAEARMLDYGLSGQLTIDDAGITENALNTLMSRKQTELRRQEIFGRAQGGFSENAFRLGTSIFTSLSDPLNVGLSFVPIFGQARYARWLARAGTPLAKAGVRMAVGAAEGVVGAAAIEPIIYGSRTAEQADYDSVDSLMNASFGGVFGATLHTGFGALRDVGRGYRLRKLKAERAARGLTPPPEVHLNTSKYTVVTELTPEQRAGIDAKYKASQEAGEVGDKAAAIDYLSRVPEDHGFEKFYVINKDGEVVAGLSVGREGDKAHGMHLGSVEPGAGRYLVKHLLKNAEQLGVKQISLDARPGSEKFHERMGFKQNVKESTDPWTLDTTPGERMSRELPERAQYIQQVREAVDQVVNDAEVDVIKHAPEGDSPAIVFDKEPHETWSQTISRVAKENDYPEAGVQELYNMYLEDGLSDHDAAVAALDEAELLPDSAYHGDLGTSQPRTVEGTRGPDPEIEESIRQADEISKEVPEDPAEAIDEEVANAESDLKAVEKELGVEEVDPENTEIDEAVKRVNDWAKAAEAATSCLMKGIE